MFKDGVRHLAGALLGAMVVVLGAPCLCPGFCSLPQEKAEENCALLTSPEIVRPGDTLRILAAADVDIRGADITITGPSGRIRTTKAKSGGGPPFWWSAEAALRQEGGYTVSLIRRRRTIITRGLNVSTSRPTANTSRGIWQAEEEWTRGTENLYSAWIDSLFHDADESSSWKALHAVTRDLERNILYNRLSLGEDNEAGENSVVMEPDCADAPYFLRAYFAWKMRLPFGFGECTRGTLERAPECQRWFSNMVERGPRTEAQAFNNFLRFMKDAIHSGTARTLLEDEQSDFYPLPLTRESLRPGVVFADPYGHTLVLVRWLPQTAKHPGRLFAVDAQPDGTIGLRRFWRGNFLFNTKNIIGNPGFKAFRPVIAAKGRLRPMTNKDIRTSADYADFSLQQKNMATEEFYDIMERLINPEPLDPVTALHDLFTAFLEQLATRVTSVANAEDYKKAHPGATIPMPNGTADVFQDVGLWEDYSTPNRDMRLLIAMDALFEFPQRLVRSPQSFRWPKRKTREETQKQLEELRQKWARDMSITYTRSDGTPQTLTVEEILKRGEAFEMAYNPNDCIETRWGAPEGSQERSTCRRTAPAAQQERMKSLRHWFRDRLRPPT